MTDPIGRAREALDSYRNSDWLGPADDEGWDHVEALLAVVETVERCGDE